MKHLITKIHFVMVIYFCTASEEKKCQRENRNTKMTKQKSMKQNSEDMNKQMKGECPEMNPERTAGESKTANTESNRLGRYSSLVQVFIPICVAAFLLADQFVKMPAARWAMVGLSFMMILVPLIHRWVLSRRRLTLRKALEIMSARGLDARIKGNEILWRAAGQINVLRMNGALIQVSREFELEGAEENVRSMEKAATETMREVSLAKVIVTRPSPNSIGLSFMTEAFCSSPRTFSEFLPAYIEVLDVAEERQRFHFKEVKPERRRIGFNV